jgi:hypothetical protein
MQKIRFVGFVFAVSLFFASGFSAGAPIRGVQDNLISGRDISFSAVTSDGTPVPTDVQGVELKWVPIAVRAGDSIKQLLEANAIYPDVEAYGLIYDLNPALTSTSLIKEGDQLILPGIERGDVRPTLPNGQLVALTVDARLKTELLNRVEALDNTITAISDLGVDRFNDANQRSSIVRSLKDVSDSFAVFAGVIKEKVVPVNSEVVSQVDAEAELLKHTLDQFVQTQGKPKPEDLDTINLIDEDLKVKRRNLTDVRGPNEPPARWPLGVVIVKTLGQDGREIPNLEIYYVPEALQTDVPSIKTFNRRSSPSQQSLPEANYVIWAGRPGQGTVEAALSDLKKVSVRKSSDASVVDLSIIR